LIHSAAVGSQSGGFEVKRCRLVLLSVLTSLVLGVTVPSVAEKPSTPKQRTRLVSITQKLEANPLDPGLRSERKWAIEWLIRVPDIRVTLCPSILGDYFKYKYADEITAQLILAEARFSIENPDKASDQTARYVAAAQSAIKAYGVLLENDPQATSKVLDDATQKQSQGKLNEFVADRAGKDCRNKS
jgi:hypothetical protein